MTTNDALQKAGDDFARQRGAIDVMESAGLPAQLDRDARDLVRLIQEHGQDYAGTEYGDMTTRLLESLRRLVVAAAAAKRPVYKRFVREAGMLDDIDHPSLGNGEYDWRGAQPEEE